MDNLYDDIPMTKSQKRALGRIKQLVDKECQDSNSEIKVFDVEQCGRFLNVIVELGMPNDECTLAQVFCRDHAQVFIGRHGGITYPTMGKRGGYKRNTFHGYSLLEAVCAQR